MLNITSLGAINLRSDQNFPRYAEEYKSKYLQYDCEKHLQLGMMRAFFSSLDKSIPRKIYEKETSRPQCLKLFDVVIRLDDAREGWALRHSNCEEIF